MINNIPKVLVITVNPFSSTQNNGKTFASIFKNFPSENIAQIYKSGDIDKNVPNCNRYFNINTNNYIDKNDLIKEIDGWKEVLIDQIRSNNFCRLTRDILIILKGWKSDALIKWINDFKPELIFFCGGDALYLYNTTLKIAVENRCQLIYFITDDYVLPRFSLDLFYWIRLGWMRRLFKKTSRHSAEIYCISDKMRIIYEKNFKISSKIIMHCVKLLKNDYNSTASNHISFIYTGGLHFNRWKVLAMIGDCLRELSKKGITGTLRIYSKQNPNSRMLRSLHKPPYISYCGSLEENELKEIQTKADVLVHVESFDYKSKKSTFLSISTKISEYMSLGRCIFAIGPSEVASIQYLCDNKIGVVINKKKKVLIKSALERLITRPEVRMQYGDMAYDFAEKFHNEKKILDQFERRLVEINKSSNV